MIAVQLITTNEMHLASKFSTIAQVAQVVSKGWD